jgi:hypothetical protein
VDWAPVLFVPSIFISSCFLCQQYGISSIQSSDWCEFSRIPLKGISQARSSWAIEVKASVLFCAAPAKCCMGLLGSTALDLRGVAKSIRCRPRGELLGRNMTPVGSLKDNYINGDISTLQFCPLPIIGDSNTAVWVR